MSSGSVALCLSLTRNNVTGYSDIWLHLIATRVFTRYFCAHFQTPTYLAPSLTVTITLPCNNERHFTNQFNGALSIY